MDTETKTGEDIAAEEFNKGLKELLAKFPDFALGAQAVILEDGRVGAKPILVRIPKQEEKIEEKTDLVKE